MLYVIHAGEGAGHNSLCGVAGGESAAAEVSEVCAGPGRCIQACVDVLFGHVPPGLHYALAVLVLYCAGSVQCCRAGVYQVDKSVCRFAVWSPAGHALHGIRRPVCAHVCEYRCASGQQVQEHQGSSVERVVFRCEGDRLACAVPVEGGVKYSFCEISIGHEVRPHSLTLESAQYGVPALGFLKPAHFCELRVALEDIADYAGHLRDELPVLLLFLCGEYRAHVGHARGGVDVYALGAFLLYPGERLLVLGFIVYPQLFAADYLGHVDPLGVYTEVIAEEFLVAVGSGNTHSL